MFTDDYHWHFNYTRLAWDYGFCFGNRKSKVSLERNSLSHIDIERVIRERDVATVERHLLSILDFTLDSEQTSILDPRFVKVFRIGQLSVDYLLFCKTYLDNTVAILKKELLKSHEENKGLKQYTDQLKQDITYLKKKVKELKAALHCHATCNDSCFRCKDCTKIFGTEEHLSAHIKRRHTATTSPTPFQAETDKLQLEIKELKERLNNTEKFIHNDDITKPPPTEDVESKPMEENVALKDLQQKFELLKCRVEDELKTLQTQQFEQERYEKWFETFLNKLEVLHSKGPKNQLNEGIAIGGGDFVEKVSSTTQTDVSKTIEVAECHACRRGKEQQGNVRAKVRGRTYRSASDEAIIFDKLQQQLRRETESSLERFGEEIGLKFTGSIEKLEDKLQSFWKKLEVQKQSTQLAIASNIPNDTDSSKSEITANVMQITRPKPENPFSNKIVLPVPIPAKRTMQKITTTKQPALVISKSFSAHRERPIIHNVSEQKNSYVASESESNSTVKTSSSESESKEIVEQDTKPTAKASRTSTLGQRSITSLKKATFTPDVLQGLQKELKAVVNSKLEGIGVSPSWTGLPVRSYQRAANIVSHHVSLAQKNYPNYQQIRNQIEKKLEEQTKTRRNNTTKTPKIKDHLSQVKNINRFLTRKNSAINLIPATSKAKNIECENQPAVPKATVKQQPKTMYVTDTESDVSALSDLQKSKPKLWEQSAVVVQTQKAYSDVVQQLNKIQKQNNKFTGTPSESSVEEIVEQNSALAAKEEESNKQIHADATTHGQTKGVLKNYPSMVSLQKKRVLFDIESENMKKKVENEVIAITAEGGSTTSIASSVFDGSKTNLAQDNYLGETLSTVKTSSKKVEDDSDFDFSEILH